MKINPILIIPSFACILLSCNMKDPEPQFAGWDYDHMIKVKKSIKRNTSVYYPAFEKLIKEADNSLGRGPFSVTFKKIIPPGGTINDYMSQGPYWWPDTTKPDGLPYIRRDGVRNPESGIDRTQLGNLISAVENLSLAWYFTSDRKYADKAASLLRVWFIQPETRMNPHLEFGQSIPGITSGRGIGIIDVRGMHGLVDAISLLDRSGALASKEREQITDWEETENGLGLLIRSAARYYDEPGYQIIWEKTFSERMKSDRTLLVTPGL